MAPPDRSVPKAFIFLNGDFETPLFDWPARPGPADLVIGADGGGRHPAALGWPTHVLVGDFDSLDERRLAGFAADGAEILRHPAAKNEIDFELALALALRRGYEDMDVLGALGGRWDMTLGGLLLPTGAPFSSARVRFRHGPWNFSVLRGPAEFSIAGRPGDLLSLLPLGSDVLGARLSGCRYPLAGETLRAGLSRGLSNELADADAALSFDSGALMVMHRAS